MSQPATDAPDLFEQAGQAWNVDPALLRAIQGVESGGDDRAVSNKGAIGRMQLMPRTAAALGVTDPNDPAQSIFGGAKLMRQNLDATNGDVPTALQMYQGGPNRAIWGPQNAAYPGQVLSRLKGAQQTAQASPVPANDAFSAAFGGGGAAPSGDALIDAAVSRLRTGQGAAPPVAAPVAPAQAPEATGDAFSAAFAPPAPAAAPADAAAVPAASPGPTDPNAPSPGQQPLLARIGAGIQQGVMDVAGTGAKAVAGAAQWVDNRVPALAALDRAGGLDPSRVAPGLDAQAQQFQQQYGNDTAANVSRMGGQIVGSLPVMGGANALAGLAGRAVLGGTGEAFLTGQLGNNLLTRAPSLAAQGAITGAASEAATGRDPTVGALTGAVAGPVVGAASSALFGGVNKLLGRGASAVSPEVAQLADLAQTKYGIPLRADQLAQSGAVRMAGDAVNRLPMTGGTEFTAQQLTAYNRAVANTIGENADALTPAVMSSARARIGGMFDNVESKMSIPVVTDTTLINQLGQIENDARKVMTPEQSNIISGQITDVLDKAIAGNGALDGPAFRNFVKRDTPLDRIANSNDPNVSHYAEAIQDALRDSLERSLPPGSPVLQEYQQARQQYRNLQTIKQLAAKAPTGTVSPALMMGAALRNDPNMAFTGGGDLGDLARIGQQFIKAPANSGTAERSLALNALMGAGKLVGAGLAGGGGYALGGAPAALAAGGGSLLLGQLIAHRLQDPDLVNRLIQSGIKSRLPAVGNALMNNIQPYVAGSAPLALPQPSP